MFDVEYKISHTHTHAHMHTHTHTYCCFLVWSPFSSLPAGMLFCGKVRASSGTNSFTSLEWHSRCCNELKCLPSYSVSMPLLQHVSWDGNRQFTIIETINVLVFDFKAFRVWVLIKWCAHIVLYSYTYRHMISQGSYLFVCCFWFFILYLITYLFIMCLFTIFILFYTYYLSSACMCEKVIVFSLFICQSF